MLRFSIYAPDSLITVDNASAVISLAPLPTNVVVVAFQKDIGSVEYNDRPNLRVPITDPSPYQPQINLWITAAAAQTPALQIAQAKQVKVDLVQAIYDHKRRLPYTYNGKVYETSDEAVTMMTAAMVSGTSGDTGGLVSSINTALATITGQINSQVVAVNNGSAAAVNDWSYYNSLNWPKFGFQFGSLTGGVGGNHDYTYLTSALAGVSYGGFATMGVLAGASVAAGGGSITWQPIGSPDPIALPGSELSGALGGIVTRRNALNNNRVDKQAAINALSTIAAVTAYDATTGWSF